MGFQERPATLRKTPEWSLFIVMLLLLTCCGGTAGRRNQVAAGATEFVYVASEIDPSTTVGISELAVTSAGGLQRVSGSPILLSSPGAPFLLAADPQGRFLFEANGNALFSLAMDRSSGALTLVSSAVTSTQPFAVTAEPNGRAVYVVSGSDLQQNHLSVYSIGAGGALTQLQAIPVGKSQGIAVNPAGSFALVSAPGCQGTTLGCITSFAVDSATGDLMQTRLPPVSGPFSGALAVTPDGRFLYAAAIQNAEGQIRSFSIGTDGALTPVATTTVAPNNTVVLAMHPSGRFLYADDTMLMAFSIDPASGRLTHLPGDQNAPTGAPLGQTIATDPMGKVLYVVEGSSEIAAFSIAPDGTFSALSGSPFQLDVPGGFAQTLAVTAIK